MEIPRHWRLKKQRYGLVGSVCPRCDTKSFPPVEICRVCREKDETREVIVYSSKLPLYTSDSYTGELEKQPQLQEQ